MIIKKEKVYSVEFMEYTNCMKDTVSDIDRNELCTDWSKANYLEVGNSFLVKESDIQKYQKYGGGYRSLTFVGWIEIPEEKESFSVEDLIDRLIMAEEISDKEWSMLLERYAIDHTSTTTFSSPIGDVTSNTYKAPSDGSIMTVYNEVFSDEDNNTKEDN